MTKLEPQEALWLRTKAHAHLRAALRCLSDGQSDLSIVDSDLHHRVALVFRELEETSQELRIRTHSDDDEPEQLTRPAPEGVDKRLWAKWRLLCPEDFDDFTAKVFVQQMEMSANLAMRRNS